MNLAPYENRDNQPTPVEPPEDSLIVDIDKRTPPNPQPKPPTEPQPEPPTPEQEKR